MSGILQYSGKCSNCDRGHPDVDIVVPFVHDKGGGAHSSGYLCMDCLRNELYKNKNRTQQENELPKSITVAEDLKKKEFLQKKAKLGDGSNIAAEDR